MLREGLLRLGEGDGWGSTNANAAAMRALAAVWRRPRKSDRADADARERRAASRTLDADAPVAELRQRREHAARHRQWRRCALVALVETSFEPSEPGAEAPAPEGFRADATLWRVNPGDAPPSKLAPSANGAIHLKQGDVVEEAAELANPQDRTHVAISLPLAAGFEPLNPNLANAPREALPSCAPTLAPTWTSFGDDRVFYAYDTLPKGNYRFAFRTKAQTVGRLHAAARRGRNHVSGGHLMARAPANAS